MRRSLIYVVNFKSMSGLQFYICEISKIWQTFTLGIFCRSMHRTHIFAHICFDIAELCKKFFRKKIVVGDGGWSFGKELPCSKWCIVRNGRSAKSQFIQCLYNLNQVQNKLKLTICYLVLKIGLTAKKRLRK